MYEFKGYDWAELAECWGIEVKEIPFNANVMDKNGNVKEEEFGKFPEKIDITYRINNTKIVFTTEDSEEVLAEKIKRYIVSNLDYQTGSFINKQMRVDIENFLKALIRESKKTDYNHPVYEGLLKVENDQTLAHWICQCLELLWT